MIRAQILGALFAALLFATAALAQTPPVPLGPSGGGGGGGGVSSVATACGITGGPVTTSGTVSDQRLVNAQTGTSYPFVAADCGKLVTFSNAAAVAATLPQAGSAGFAAGVMISVQNLGLGLVTITPATSTIGGAAFLQVPQTVGYTLVSDGANWQVHGLGTGPLAGLLPVNALNVGMAPGGQDNAPFVSALMNAISPSPAGNVTGGSNVVFPAVFGKAQTAWFFSGSLRISRGGTFNCGNTGPRQEYNNLVFAAGVDGVVNDNTVTSLDGGTSAADIVGCSILSLGFGSARATNGSAGFTNVLQTVQAGIVPAPWAAGDGIIAFPTFQQGFNFTGWIGGSSYQGFISNGSGAAGTALVTSNVASGSAAPAIGQPIVCINSAGAVATTAGTLIASGSGTNWVVNKSQLVGTSGTPLYCYNPTSSGTILTVPGTPGNAILSPSASAPGVLAAGQSIQTKAVSNNSPISGNEVITNQIDGAAGGIGRYTVSISGTFNAHLMITSPIAPIVSPGAYVGSVGTGTLTLASPYVASLYQATAPLSIQTWRLPAALAYHITTTSYLGSITGGSGGTDGVYNNIAMTGGSGAGMIANVTVSGGAVTNIVVVQPNTPNSPGSVYVVGDTISAASGDIGGVTGFSVPVNTTAAAAESITVVSGPTRVLESGDMIWGDFAPFGTMILSVSSHIYPQTAVLDDVQMQFPYPASVTHASGSGQMWMIPAGLKRRQQSRAHKVYINGFGIGLSEACSSAGSLNCTTSVDAESQYERNIIGHFATGDNTGASSYFANETINNFLAAEAEFGGIGSNYSGDNLNDSEESSTSYPLLALCTSNNTSIYTGEYIGNEGTPVCIQLNQGIALPPVNLSESGPLLLAPMGGGFGPVDMHTIYSGSLLGCWQMGEGSIEQNFKANCQGAIYQFTMNDTINNSFDMTYNQLLGSYDLLGNNNASYVVDRYTGGGTTPWQGYVGDGGNYHELPRGYLLGGPGIAVGGERLNTEATAKPTTATALQGDIAYNSSAIMGGAMGWCDTAGGGANFAPCGPISLSETDNIWAGSAFVSNGGHPTLNTGSCTATLPVGGATVGSFTAPVCASGTIILSSLPAAINGYTCTAWDQTTPADTLTQTANSTTSSTLKATTVAGDAIVFSCMGW